MYKAKLHLKSPCFHRGGRRKRMEHLANCQHPSSRGVKLLYSKYLLGMQPVCAVESVPGSGETMIKSSKTKYYLNKAKCTHPIFLAHVNLFQGEGKMCNLLWGHLWSHLSEFPLGAQGLEDREAEPHPLKHVLPAQTQNDGPTDRQTSSPACFIINKWETTLVQVSSTDKATGTVMTSKFQKSQTLFVGKSVCFLSISTPRSARTPSRLPFLPGPVPRAQGIEIYCGSGRCQDPHLELYVHRPTLKPLTILEVATVSSFLIKSVS